MLACARIGAVHSWCSAAFPRTSCHAHRRRQAEGHRCRLLRHRDEPRRALQAAARPRDREATHKPERCVILPPAGAGRLIAGRDVGWARRWPPRSGGLRAGRGHRSAVHPLYVGTTASPRASSATTAATRSRSAGRWRTSTASSRARFLGRVRRRWVVGHSYIVYGPLLHGCTTVVYEGKPVGTPDPGAFWRVIASTRVGDVHAPTASAPSSARTRRPRTCSATTSGSSARCSSPGSGATRIPSSGPDHAAGAGDRPLVADRDGLAIAANCWHRAAAGQAARRPRPSRLRRARPRRGRARGARRRHRRIMIRLPMPPAVCRRCGTTTRASRRPT